MADTIERLITRKNTYSTGIKVCFILRILSITLQCLTFGTLENDSWTSLRKLLYRGTCKKIQKLSPDDYSTTTTSISGRHRQSPSEDHERGELMDIDNDGSEFNSINDNADNNLLPYSTERIDDDDFEEETKPESSVMKKPENKKDHNGLEDQTEIVEGEMHSLTRETSVAEKPHEKNHQTESEKNSSRQHTSRKTDADDLTPKIDNIEPISQPISSKMSRGRISKPKTNHKPAVQEHSHIRSSLSSADDSNASKCSDDEIKPLHVVKTTAAISHDSSDELKHPQTTAHNTYRKRIDLQTRAPTNRHETPTEHRRTNSSKSANRHTHRMITKSEV